jgi:uncharacterized damage-inducible protein DinB
MAVQESGDQSNNMDPIASHLLSEKPRATEYPAYAEIYMRLVAEGVPLLEQMSRNCESTMTLLSSLDEKTLLSRYAADKWTIKDTILHVTDDERIYTYRALRFARSDRTALPGFDQEDFARSANANERPILDLLEEFRAVRQATILLFRSMSDASLLREGVADGKRSTVRALAYHIAGHELHHMQLVRNLYLAHKAMVDQ